MSGRLIGAPVGIPIASFSLAFSMSTWIKNCQKEHEIKRKKHNKNFMLARSN